MNGQSRYSRLFFSLLAALWLLAAFSFICARRYTIVYAQSPTVTPYATVTPYPTVAPLATVTPYPTVAPYATVTPQSAFTPTGGLTAALSGLSGLAPMGPVFCAGGNAGSLCTADGSYMEFVPSEFTYSLSVSQSFGINLMVDEIEAGDGVFDTADCYVWSDAYLQGFSWVSVHLVSYEDNEYLGAAHSCYIHHQTPDLFTDVPTSGTCYEAVSVWLHEFDDEDRGSYVSRYVDGSYLWDESMGGGCFTRTLPCGDLHDYSDSGQFYIGSTSTNQEVRDYATTEFLAAYAIYTGTVDADVFCGAASAITVTQSVTEDLYIINYTCPTTAWLSLEGDAVDFYYAPGELYDLEFHDSGPWAWSPWRTGSRVRYTISPTFFHDPSGVFSVSLEPEAGPYLLDNLDWYCSESDGTRIEADSPLDDLVDYTDSAPVCVNLPFHLLWDALDALGQAPEDEWVSVDVCFVARAYRFLQYLSILNMPTFVLYLACCGLVLYAAWRGVWS